MVKCVFSIPCCGKYFSKPSYEAEVQNLLSNENKNFCSSWNAIFEIGIFSFNSYVYYLTRGFIAPTRAFNLLTRAFKPPTRAFDLATCDFNLATRAFSLLTRGFELLTPGFELVTRELELVTRKLELVTRGFELVTRGFELVTRNSCFTFPHSHAVILKVYFFTCSHAIIYWRLFMWRDKFYLLGTSHLSEIVSQ